MRKAGLQSEVAGAEDDIRCVSEGLLQIKSHLVLCTECPLVAAVH